MGTSGMGSTVLGVKWTLEEPEVTFSVGTSGGGADVDPRPN